MQNDRIQHRNRIYMHVSIYIVLTDGAERFCKTKIAGNKSAKGILLENII
jgi:hypothetical protein